MSSNELWMKFLENMKELNCNMVRCWGGNAYESDKFYDFFQFFTQIWLFYTCARLQKMLLKMQFLHPCFLQFQRFLHVLYIHLDHKQPMLHLYFYTLIYLFYSKEKIAWIFIKVLNQLLACIFFCWN